MADRDILILGAGVWGSAVGSLLSDNGYSVDIWSYRADEIDSLNMGVHKNLSLPISKEIRFFHEDLEKISIDYRYIFIALPVPNIFEHISKLNLQDKKVVILSKGLVKDGVRISQLFDSKKIATLYGAVHSDELLRREYSSFVATSSDIEYAKEISSLFTNRYVKLFVSEDIIFSEVMAALKNVVAIALGILSGLGTSQSTLLSLLLQEVERVLIAMNSNMHSFLLPNGVGDLFATISKGRNRSFGESIGRGEEHRGSMVVEGKSTLKVVVKMAEKLNLDLPIHNLVYSIIYKGRDPKSILQMLEGEIK